MITKFYLLDSAASVTSLGQAEPKEFRLVRSRAVSVMTADDLSVLVSDEVGEALRSAVPHKLLMKRVRVWPSQAQGGEPDDEHMCVSSESSLRLLPSLVARRSDGTVEKLSLPFVLDRQELVPGVHVFTLRENPALVLFSEHARDVLKSFSPRLKWDEVPFVDG